MLAYTVGPTELLIVLALLVLLFGAKKLPELAKGMGQAVKEFKRGISETSNEESSAKAGSETEKKEE